MVCKEPVPVQVSFSQPQIMKIRCPRASDNNNIGKCSLKGQHFKFLLENEEHTVQNSHGVHMQSDRPNAIWQTSGSTEGIPSAIGPWLTMPVSLLQGHEPKKCMIAGKYFHKSTSKLTNKTQTRLRYTLRRHAGAGANYKLYKAVCFFDLATPKKGPLSLQLLTFSYQAATWNKLGFPNHNVHVHNTHKHT